MPSSSDEIIIQSLRGGMNNDDPPHIISDDQVVLAENVEFFFSTLGERRRGMEEVSLTGSSLGSEDEIVHLTTHLPRLSEIQDTELWGIGATPGSSVTISKRSGGTWTDVSTVATFANTSPEIYQIQSTSFAGDLYFTAKSDLPRVHVYDGTTIRPAGLAAPAAAPTTADTVGAGSFTGDRTYRVRFIKKSGSVILLRSEPSAEVTHSPSGTNIGVIVTRPALIGEGETHWELEASDGDGNFYIIDTIAIATTTSTDTTADPTDYAEFTLSEDIGEYGLIPAAKFIRQDQNRLIFAGDWEEEENGSRISWSPVSSDPGVGNSERLPTNTDNFIDLGHKGSGDLTGISEPVNGSFYAFKWRGIHKVQRTGDVNEAYEAFLLTSTRGAIPGSIVSGMDEYGRGCIYFLDPATGPTRIGQSGIQAMQNLGGTWRTVNTSAAKIIAHGVYYPDKQQLKWWVSTESEDTPNLELTLQVSSIRSTTSGAERGWSVATGTRATALCSAILPEEDTDEDTGNTSLFFRQYLGFTSPNFIQRSDIGFTDNGDPYTARIKTKPLFPLGLLTKFGVLRGAFVAEPNDDIHVNIDVKLVKDGGTEEVTVNTDFYPDLDQDFVIRTLDNLSIADASSIQLEFSDHETVVGGKWEMHRFDLKIRREGQS